MTISASAWHYRLYTWWFEKFGLKERPLDLCRYMRSLLVWLPLSCLVYPFYWMGVRILRPTWWLLSRSYRPVSIVASTTPAKKFGSKLERFFKAIAAHEDTIALVIAAAVATLLLVGLGAVFYSSWIHGLLVLGVFFTIIAFIITAVWLAESKGDTFALGWAWISAKKRRVCPLLSVDK